jgi:hypothetical protein
VVLHFGLKAINLHNNNFLQGPGIKLVPQTNMLFNRASRNLFNGAYKRFQSTAADVGSSEVAFAGMGAVATTFGTYMIADFLSNFIQHPTQKVCLSVTSRMLNSSTSLFHH